MTIQGIVTTAFDTSDPLVDAEVVLYDADFEEVSRARTDERGVFSLLGLPGAFVHIVIDGGDGYVPAAFPGETGLQETLSVGEGALWGVSTAEVLALRETFAACPGSDLDGIVAGTLRLDLGLGIDNPPESFGFAKVELSETEEVPGCYLDGDGVMDPEAERTGPTGRFAMFGVEGGPVDLVVGRDTLGGTLLSITRLYVPRGGVVLRPAALIPL